MQPMDVWWKECPSESVSFAHFNHWQYHPILSFSQRMQILKNAHKTPSFFHINLLQEYLALFPELVHLRPEQERINIPGTIQDHNWSYQFRPTLEEIISHVELKEKIKEILQN
jgi:4-alpha-glucanotransferase